MHAHRAHAPCGRPDTDVSLVGKIHTRFKQDAIYVFNEQCVCCFVQVDMVISPISSSLLGVGPVAYPLVMGDINLVKLLKILKPK
eukprot:scaffold184742_cov17-Tisochrysis_lutea.AAC.3